MFGVVGDEYPILLYRQLIHLRIRKTAVFEVIDEVFDIKQTIEFEKGCPMGHVFIEEQFMFIKPFAQFIGLCSSLKWSRHRTKSPFLALPATAGSNAAYKIISACSNAVS